MLFQIHADPPKSKTNPPSKTSKPQQSTKKPQPPQRPTENNGQGQIFNECEGECVGGLFALFCDDIDTDAFCPNEGQCCVSKEDRVETTTPKVTTPVKIS